MIASIIVSATSLFGKFNDETAEQRGRASEKVHAIDNLAAEGMRVYIHRHCSDPSQDRACIHLQCIPGIF
jgi:hypothetical protein